MFDADLVTKEWRQSRPRAHTHAQIKNQYDASSRFLLFIESRGHQIQKQHNITVETQRYNYRN